MSEYSVPARSNTAIRTDADGNKVEEYQGSGQPPIRTHDQSDQDAINQKLFGSSGTRGDTTVYKDKDGNKVETYTGPGSGPSIRAHDQTDPKETERINKALFSQAAPKPASRSNTHTYKNADGDQETVHAGSEAPGIRTHNNMDAAAQAELDRKLFGM